MSEAYLQAKKEAHLGGWVQIGHYAVIEILGSAGYDWLAFDLEHGEVTIDQIGLLCMTAEKCGVKPYVRVSEISRPMIQRCLDQGAQGLIVPMIETVDQIDQLVAYCGYPPDGKRGVAFCRANNYGGEANDFDKFPFLVAQVETKLGLENLEKIAAHPKISAVMFGPQDLACSLEIDRHSNEFNQVIENGIKRIVQSENTMSGTHILECNKENISKAISDGHRFIALGVDTSFLRESARNSLMRS